MRSVRPDGVERDWQTTAWMAAGFGLAAVSGFFGSLLKEREALIVAQRSAMAAARIGSSVEVRRAAVSLPDEPLTHPAQARA